MKYFFIVFFSLITIFQTVAQTLVLDSLVALPNQLVESSGLLFFDGKLITHTDSGGESALYEIDTNTAQILRTVYISNATNKDWEDITQDNNYIYVGDFGNNSGNRTDLKILKINKADYLIKDSVQAEFIYFTYEDQTDFTATNQSTNFDAEAIISVEDSLYIFSKNWGNEETNLYILPKDTGTFTAKKIANYNVQGMVTGADYNKNTNTIFLIGYIKLGLPFAVHLENFTSNKFFEGTVNRLQIQLKGSVQTEAICSSADKKYYVSSEKFYTLQATLHSFNKDNISLQNIDKIKKHAKTIATPNPTSSFCCLDRSFLKALLYTNTGKLVKPIEAKCFDISDQENGIYYIKLFFENRESQVLKIVKP